MTLLGGRRRPGLGARLDALDTVLSLAPGRVDEALVADAERVAGKAGDRLRFGEAHTVVALAGATGSGKSSLFNAIAGTTVSDVGLRRPTTGVAHAAVWGADDAGGLLEWLGVPRRHVLPGAAEGLDGLVLLDLPDVDSVEVAHRLEADRLVELVDVLVWVLDPQKYADAAVHDRYLAPLAGHAGVMLVVLNQVDRLPAAARAGCLEDLSGLLAREGLGSVPVLPASAVSGEGLDALRAELTRRVAAKKASVSRLEADLSALAAAFEPVSGGGATGSVGRADRAALAAALAGAAGVDVVTAAVAENHRMRARRATGWPFTRWAGRLRLDPAKRLRLRETPSELVRTSLPGPSAVQRARLDGALRSLAEAASDGLEDPWPTVVRRAAGSRRDELPDLLDRAVAGADLGLARRPRWWALAGLVQWLLALAVVAGLVWLAALFVVAWLQLPDPPLPRLGPVPVPTVLLLGGAVLGLLLALLSRALSAAGAHRAAARARRTLTARVDAVAADAVVTPVETELAAHTDLRTALAELGG